MNKSSVHQNKCILGPIILFSTVGAVSLFYFIVTRNLYPLPQLYAAQDIGLLLDPGWRLIQGQMPHRDYISALGILWAFICAFPLFIWGPYYDSYTLFPAILFTFFSFLALVCTFQRLSRIMSLAFSITTGLVASGTYHIGFSPELLSFANLYTRISYAILLVIFLVALLPPELEKKREMVAGLISGILTCSLLFLKVNFCLVALAVCAWGGLSQTLRIRKDFYFGFIFSFVIALALGFSLIGFSFSSFLRDMSYVASCRLSDVYLNSHLYNPEKIILSNISLILFSLPFLLVLFIQGNISAGISTLLVIGSTLALGISQSSGEGFGLPGMPAAFFISSHWITKNIKLNDLNNRIFVNMTAIAISCWIVVIPQLISCITWFKVSESISLKIGDSIRSTNAPLSTLYAGSQNNWGDLFMPMVNEARELAGRHVTEDKNMQFVDLSNFVNFGTFRSPKNSSLAADILVNVSPINFQKPEILFSDTDFLLLPKQPSSGLETQKVWINTYGEYILNNFKMVEETKNFTLLKK